MSKHHFNYYAKIDMIDFLEKNPEYGVVFENIRSVERDSENVNISANLYSPFNEERTPSTSITLKEDGAYLWYDWSAGGDICLSNGKNYSKSGTLLDFLALFHSLELGRVITKAEAANLLDKKLDGSYSADVDEGIKKREKILEGKSLVLNSDEKAKRMLYAVGRNLVSYKQRRAPSKKKLIEKVWKYMVEERMIGPDIVKGLMECGAIQYNYDTFHKAEFVVFYTEDFYNRRVIGQKPIEIKGKDGKIRKTNFSNAGSMGGKYYTCNRYNQMRSDSSQRSKRLAVFYCESTIDALSLGTLADENIMKSFMPNQAVSDETGISAIDGYDGLLFVSVHNANNINGISNHLNRISKNFENREQDMSVDVYLCFDEDEAGNKMTEKARTLLGAADPEIANAYSGITRKWNKINNYGMIHSVADLRKSLFSPFLNGEKIDPNQILKKIKSDLSICDLFNPNDLVGHVWKSETPGFTAISSNSIKKDVDLDLG